MESTMESTMELSQSIANQTSNALPQTVSSNNKTRKPPICRNCGQDGHLHCKRIFSDEERKRIKDSVIHKLQERLQSVERPSKDYNEILKNIRNILAEVGSKRLERIQKNKRRT